MNRMGRNRKRRFAKNCNNLKLDGMGQYGHK